MRLAPTGRASQSGADTERTNEKSSGMRNRRSRSARTSKHNCWCQCGPSNSPNSNTCVVAKGDSRNRGGCKSHEEEELERTLTWSQPQLSNHQSPKNSRLQHMLSGKRIATRPTKLSLRRAQAILTQGRPWCQRRRPSSRASTPGPYPVSSARSAHAPGSFSPRACETRSASGTPTGFRPALRSPSTQGRPRRRRHGRPEMP